MINIGGRWALSFADAVKSPYNQTLTKSEMEVSNETNPIEESGFQDTEYYQLMFNLYLMTCYQATNIAEAYMTQ